MIAKRYKVITGQVHHRGERIGAVRIAGQAGSLLLRIQAVIEVGHWRSLKGIAAVDDQRVAVMREGRSELHETHVPLLRIGIAGGIEIAVRIGSETDVECSFHA